MTSNTSAYMIQNMGIDHAVISDSVPVSVVFRTIHSMNNVPLKPKIKPSIHK